MAAVARQHAREAFPSLATGAAAGAVTYAATPDVAFVALAVLHGAALAAWPSILLIAAGVWWNSNTIAHNFLHRPFFQRRASNWIFSAYLSVLLGIPQSLWRDRHLAHHADRQWRLRLHPQLIVETLLVVALWTMLALRNPGFFFQMYLPGYGIGLLLCSMQGHYEHVRGAATSHYGRLYNALFFNDGYHAEHHAAPGVHWTELPARFDPDAPESRWPAALRWLETLTDTAPLEILERAVLRSPLLQRFVLNRHEQALRALLPDDIRTVTIVGGGLYPRTALILRKLLPDARITIIDANPRHLNTARQFVGEDIDLVSGYYEAGQTVSCDLLVIPLCFQGDREAIYQRPAARTVLVHDWIWRRRGISSRIVSILLFKRINLLRQ